VAVVSNLKLDPANTGPAGMVHVAGGPVSFDGNSAPVADFWMDQLETTNRQFKSFVDAGGYARREFWSEPFIEHGKPVSWAEAMTRFRDRTGRPGPATWELGTFPDGEAEFPVGGLSWYEAAAYAAFAGKVLPTVYQWRMAGDFAGPSTVFADIVLRSNFNGKGPVPVGSLKGVGPYGQLDMAGNVKEWCWNESRGGRQILGAAWNEPTYMYQDRDAQDPFERRATFGVRLVKNIDPQPAASLGAVQQAVRDYSREKPIDDAAFAIVKRLYDYDPIEIGEHLDYTEDAPAWRRETVTINAAYGGEKILVRVYLPKSAAPPYQPVIYFPGGDAPMLRSSKTLTLTNIDFVIRSGRALIFPVYKGTYERGVQQSGPNGFRDVTIARVKDFRRVADYVQSRKDLDGARIGFYGVSLGAFTGIMINAVEPRIKANVFLGGGLPRFVASPEIDPLNFVTRIQAPTLMVNGRTDFQVPMAQSQLPEFQLLALPPDRKFHALFEGGHMPNQINAVIRVILDWFDRFLGPVTPIAATTSGD